MPTRPYRQIEPHIGHDVFVDPSAVLIGDVAIGAGSSIWPTTVLRADAKPIRVGTRTNIQDGAIVRVTHASEFHPEGHATWIGSDVTIGHQAVLQGCTIEDNVLIGMGAIIMEDAIVHSHVIVGAGSLVTTGSRLQSDWMYMGSPAQPIREITREERRYNAYLAQYYAELAQQHLEDVAEARRRARLGL